MFKLALFLIVFCVISSVVSAEIQSTCSLCEQGTSCFIEVAEQCPPSSVAVDNSDLCACNAGFFMVDKKCVLCTAGYYCPGGHTDASIRRRVLSETNYSGGDLEPCAPNSQSIAGSDNASMCLCNSGYTSFACAEPPCDPMCSACEPGTYKAVASNVVDCEQCPAGTYSSSLHECTACPESTESAPGSTDVSSCVPSCEPGYTGPAGSCTACDVGKYKNSSGSSPCTTCPPGHVSYDGESSCRACVPGTYAPSYGYNCFYCPTGKYSSTFAAVSEAVCQYCDAGFYSWTSNPELYGFDLCLQCPPNSTSRPGTELGFGDALEAQCSCNAGYALSPGFPWHPTEDIRLPAEQLCQPCAAGTYQPEAVQWGEVRYSTESMHPTCLSCPAHMTSAPGSAVCVCAAGSYGVPGGPLCEPCGPNEFTTLGAMTAADCRCRAGFFREQAGSECVACPINFFHVFGEQELACVPCQSGSTTQHNASNSSAMCVVCPAGFFVAEAGDCRSCHQHATSLSGTVGSCTCDAGYAPDGDSCAPCADGYYKGLPGNEACAACSTGKVGAAVQTRTYENTSCVVCPAHTYWAATTKCENCTTNSQSAAGSVNATSCHCNAGYFAASGSCEACVPGTFKNTVSSDVVCLLCDGAEYNPYTAATACLACAPNSSVGVSNVAESNCLCDRGFTGPAGGPCVLCALGSFKTERGTEACSDCGSGAYWPEEASPTANHCLACKMHSSSVGTVGTECVCDRGFIRRNNSCQYCSPGSYCPDEGTEHACPLHSESSVGAWDISSCACVAGFHGGNGSCSICPVDFFCAGAAPEQCTGNSTTLGRLGSSNGSACLCAVGFYREADTCSECKPGSFCFDEHVLVCPANASAPRGATNASACVCNPGLRMEGGVCVMCHTQQLCSEGVVTACSPGASVVNLFCVCSAGTFCPGGSSSCVGKYCDTCPHNHWCANNLATACSSNALSPANSSAHGQCRCADGFYRNYGVCVECPLNHVCTNETRRAVAQFDSGLRTLETGTVLLDDAVCAPGMFRLARTDMCKMCPRNFFCPSERTMGLPNVVRCADNQFTYDTGAESSSECVCLAGFKMLVNSDSVRCLPCSEGQRCQGGSVVEELCHLQNKVVSTNHDACVCDIGFGMRNFECTACAAGFIKPTAGDIECRPCADASYAVNSTTCVACPEHADAKAASSACSCAAPYVWEETVGICELCAEDNYWEKSVCYVCPSLAHSRPSATMVLGVAACACAKGHIAVPQNLSGVIQCVSCADGQYESNGVCIPCPSASWAPAESSALPIGSTALSVCVCNSTCHAQLVDGSCAGECATTPDECQQCRPGHNKSSFSTPGNSQHCAACPEGSFQPLAGALLCERCPPNEWHELREQTSTGACLCTPGFARSVNASCSACAPGHYKDWLGNEICIECAIASYNPHMQATTCLLCATATENYDVLAIALASEETANKTLENKSSSALQLVLSSNTTATQASVSVLQCVCQVGQQPFSDTQGMRCDVCDRGSFKESVSHALCAYCGALSTVHGHSLLHHYGADASGATDSSHCIACPTFSGQNEALVGPGQQRMADVADCMCFRGHERTSDGCRNCSQYMIQPFFSNEVCSYCPAGHFFVDRHVPCQLCDVAEDGGDRHVGIVLNSYDTSQQWGKDESDCSCRPGFERMMQGLCKACSVGKFRSRNDTRNCEMCPYDTFQDSVAQLACIPCPTHSSTRAHAGRTSVSECVCDAGFQPISEEAVCNPCAAGTFRSSRLANESDAECLQCPAHHYCPAGATHPLQCPTGEVALPGSLSQLHCQCQLGFGRYASDSLCTLCPHGFFSTVSSNAECTPCPTNKTTTSAGTSNETLCVCIPGHGINDLIASSACTPCSTGSFAQGFRNEPCTSCGWGTVSTPPAASVHYSSCQCNTHLGLLAQY